MIYIKSKPQAKHKPNNKLTNLSLYRGENN